MSERYMTESEMIAAFNTWMAMYTNDPEAFDNLRKVAGEFRDEARSRGWLTYGGRCVDFLFSLNPDASARGKE